MCVYKNLYILSLFFMRKYLHFCLLILTVLRFLSLDSQYFFYHEKNSFYNHKYFIYLTMHLRSKESVQSVRDTIYIQAIRVPAVRIPEATGLH